MNNLLYSSLEDMAVDLKGRFDDIACFSLDDVLDQHYTRSATAIQSCLAQECKVCSTDSKQFIPVQ